MQIQEQQILDQQRRVPSHVLRRQTYVEKDWSTIDEVRELLNYHSGVMPTDIYSRFRRCRVHVGQSLYAMDQQFNGLYVVRTGSFKSVVRREDGFEHVIAFSMRGDLLGTDGVCDSHYHFEPVALTDCEVIRVPADIIFVNGRAGDDVERMLYWAISREISREMTTYALAHSSKSEVSVARFLASQSDRFAQLGCSPLRFRLFMTRRDIGNYLNITLETVSRAFTSLHQMKIINISARDVTINSLDNLRNYEG